MRTASSTTARSARLALLLDLHPVPSGPHGALPTGERRVWWDTLMQCATDPDAPEVQAVAGVLATAFEAHGPAWLPITGLSAADTRHLLARWFPGAEQALGLDWRLLAHAHRDEPRADELDDLVPLLIDAAPEPLASHEETRWLAHTLSQATLGNDHLWQDLHLPSRRELSALFVRWFPQLAQRNDRDMKWKKFLYKQLC